jgi:predicted dehydrogenase
MQAMANCGAIEAAAICDPSPEMAAEARQGVPAATLVASYDAMLAMGLDGIVIATPSALHAEQSIRALRSGAAVFCQKPLGRNADEAKAVVVAARDADRLLSVDFSYRLTCGIQHIRELMQQGDLGRVHAVDLVFHNAYGPDKPWFYDKAQSGGGCVMDLGVHLVDLALWLLDFPDVVQVTSHLSSEGRVLDGTGVEDFAVATLLLAGGTVVRLACSWRLHAGADAVIAADFYGTAGGASLRNVEGSFYDFVAERFTGTTREVLATPPDDWGGRAAVQWAEQLTIDASFDRSVEELVRVAAVLDEIYSADEGTRLHASQTQIGPSSVSIFRQSSEAIPYPRRDRWQ